MCGEFALHDRGHAFEEVEIMQSLKLPKFLGRKYDPNGTAKDFTTMVEVKVFSHEEDAFDEIFYWVENPPHSMFLGLKARVLVNVM